MTDEDLSAAYRRGDMDAVRDLSLKSLDRASERGDTAGQARSLADLARAALHRGDLAAAGEYAQRGLALAHRDGDVRLRQAAAHLMASWARCYGDLDTARHWFEQSIELELEWARGESRMGAVERHNLAHVEGRAGRRRRARDLFAVAREWTLKHEYADMVPYVTLDAALVAAWDGEPERAVRLLRTADDAFRSAGRLPDPDDAAERTALEAHLRGVLRPGEFGAVYALGALDLPTALR